MNNKIEELKERYLQFYCELGYEHPDTQKAKKEYLSLYDLMESGAEVILGLKLYNTAKL